MFVTHCTVRRLRLVLARLTWLPCLRQSRLAAGCGDSESVVLQLCPEGAIGLSPGFQPWKALSKRICPEGARDHGATGWCITRAIWSPFRGLCWGATVPRVEPHKC